MSVNPVLSINLIESSVDSYFPLLPPQSYFYFSSRAKCLRLRCREDNASGDASRWTSDSNRRWNVSKRCHFWTRLMFLDHRDSLQRLKNAKRTSVPLFWQWWWIYLATHNPLRHKHNVLNSVRWMGIDIFWTVRFSQSLWYFQTKFYRVTYRIRTKSQSRFALNITPHDGLNLAPKTNPES